MESLTGQPAPDQQRDSILRPVLLGVVLIVVVAGIAVFLWRSERKVAKTLPAYATNVKLSDLKMSAAENFVGASVSYLDGTITNAGDKAITHAVVRVIFQDSMAQVAQSEDVPLLVLKTGGPYPDAVDLNTSPLSPGQSTAFRLTFEHISNDWDHAQPQMQIVDVTLK